MRITEPTDVSASLSLSASLAEWSWLHGGCCLSSSGHKYRRPLRRWRWRWGGGGGEHPDPVPEGGGVLSTMDGWLGMSTTP